MNAAPSRTVEEKKSPGRLREDEGGKKAASRCFREQLLINVDTQITRFSQKSSIDPELRQRYSTDFEDHVSVLPRSVCDGSR